MTSLRLALTEIKRFSGGVMPKLVLIAMLCIPLLYGGVYLYSNWDIYGNVDEVKGALVVSDKGATTEDGTFRNTGQEVGDELRESADFDWHDYPDREAAVEDVTDGTVDFALVIPADFTEHLLSTSRFAPDEDGNAGPVDPESAGIELITNDANNYLLTNIVGKAGTSVRDTVSSEVGEETASQLLASFTTIHDQVAEAADGSREIANGTVELSSAIDQLKDGTAQLKDGALQLNDGALTLVDGQGQLLAGARDGLDGARALDDGARRVDEGATELSGGLGQLADGTGRLSDATATAAKGGRDLASGSAELADGAGQLKDGADRLSSGAGELADGTRSLSEGASDLRDGTSQLDESLQSSGLGEVSTNLDQVCADLSAINDAEATGRLGTDVSNAVVSEVGSVVAEQVQPLVDSGVLTQAQADQIVTDVSGEAARSRVADATAKGLDRFEASDVGSGLTELRGSACAAGGGSSIGGQIDTLLDAVAQIDAGAGRLDSGLEEASTAAGTLADGATTLADRTGDLADGADELSSGAGTLADGLSTLDDKVGDLDSAAGQLNAGATRLTQGTGQLRDGTGQLVSGVEQLVAGQERALDGAEQLADGTGKAVEGSSELDDGAGQVQDGSDRLEEGTDELNKGLEKGKDQIPDLDEDERDSLASVMSKPVQTQGSSLGSASTYGEGMGPFFMVLALWIGLLMAGQFLRASNDRALASNTSNLRVTLGSWLPFALIGAGQAVVLFTVVKLALDFEMERPWLVLLFLVLVSVSFSAIVQGLIALLEAPGKLLVLILLILQLVTCGGMMPYETLPESLRWLHHVLPMSYGLTGMRRLIYGVDLGSIAGLSALMLLYLAIGLAFSHLGTVRHRTWTLSKLHPEVVL